MSQIETMTAETSLIHESAIVDPSAKIADDVTIGPWSYIGPGVEIGSGTVIEPHVVIKGPCKIGKNNHLFQFSSVGEIPQDKKFQGEQTFLEIGDHNVIREGVTIHRGTTHGGGLTKIGDHNLLMAYVHVAHDCVIEDHTILSNNCGLAGHVLVEKFAIMGAYSGVHQFCRVGAYSFIGGGSKATQDILPFTMINGFENVKSTGINLVGLRRCNFSNETISEIKKAYKIIFRSNNSVDEALEELDSLAETCPEIRLMIQGLKRADRGIVR